MKQPRSLEQGSEIGAYTVLLLIGLKRAYKLIKEEGLKG